MLSELLHAYYPLLVSESLEGRNKLCKWEEGVERKV